MSSIADGSVIIQSSSESVPCPPPWFGEIVLLVAHLKTQGVLTQIGECVQFTRRRFGRYEVIDFLAVFFGYAVSFERTLEAFYEALLPWAEPFMALFDRRQLPSRAFWVRSPGQPLKPGAPSSSKTCLARPLTGEREIGELVDRSGEPGTSSTSMGPERPPANAPCQRGRNCLLRSVGWMSCVLPATQDASE